MKEEFVTKPCPNADGLNGFSCKYANTLSFAFQFLTADGSPSKFPSYSADKKKPSFASDESCLVPLDDLYFVNNGPLRFKLASL